MRLKLLPAALAVAVAAQVLWAGTTPAVAQPTPAAPHKVAESDDLPAPLEVKRRALRQEAMEQVLSGAARVEQRGRSRVVTLGSSAHGAGAEYVELSRASDKVFVVLAEFGDERHPDFPDQDTDPDTPGADAVRRAPAQRDPGAGPPYRQQHDLAVGLLTGLLPAALLLTR